MLAPFEGPVKHYPGFITDASESNLTVEYFADGSTSTKTYEVSNMRIYDIVTDV